MVEAGSPETLPLDAVGPLVERIVACCGHSRLKAYRLAFGWNVPTAVERLRALAAEQGLPTSGLAARSLQDWEAGAGMRPHAMDLLCRLYQTGPVQLGLAIDYTPRPDVPPAGGRGRVSGDVVSSDGFGGAAVVPIAGRWEPWDVGCVPEREVARMVAVTARESADFARGAGRSNVGPQTIEQFHADLAWLARTSW